MLQELQRHVEWGGPVWVEQVQRGLEWLGDVRGLRILDVGARYGGTSTLFGHLGAEVVGIDTDAAALEVARERARGEGLADRVQFQHRSGAPDDLPRPFDVVFTKSVLVIVPDLAATLAALASVLVDGGRLLMVENGRGPAVVHAARMIRRRSLHPHGANYFTHASLALVRHHFDVQLEHWTAFPPTLVVGAVRR